MRLTLLSLASYLTMRKGKIDCLYRSYMYKHVEYNHKFLWQVIFSSSTCTSQKTVHVHTIVHVVTIDVPLKKEVILLSLLFSPIFYVVCKLRWPASYDQHNVCVKRVKYTTSVHLHLCNSLGYWPVWWHWSVSCDGKSWNDAGLCFMISPFAPSLHPIKPREEKTIKINT